jgi:hypothetical protein
MWFGLKLWLALSIWGTVQDSYDHNKLLPITGLALYNSHCCEYVPTFTCWFFSFVTSMFLHISTLSVVLIYMQLQYDLIVNPWPVLSVWSNVQDGHAHNNLLLTIWPLYSSLVMNLFPHSPIQFFSFLTVVLCIGFNTPNNVCQRFVILLSFIAYYIHQFLLWTNTWSSIDTEIVSNKAGKKK